MNGAGNKILVLDLRGSSLLPSPEDARAIHQAQGLDYDQMMVLSDPNSRGTAAYVRIFNNDGTLAEACGNGTRCVADRLCRELGVERVDVETEAGRIVCERLDASVYRVDMGAPKLAWEAIPLVRPVADTRRVDLDWPEGDALSALGPASVVNLGNPHAVFFVADLAVVDAAAWGARIEVHPMFTQKANVTFAGVDGARPGHCPGLGAWSRPHARLWLGRLRGAGRGLPPWPHGAQGNRASARRRTRHRVARSATTMC